MLKTDHKSIIADIEALLGEIHETQKAAKASSGSSTTTKECGTACVPKAPAFDVSTLALRLTVDEVMEGSPAAAGGLKPGDVIIKYGSVDVSTYMAEDKSYLLEDVNSVTRSSVGRSIRVEALRGTEMPILSVVPAKWSGPGVLGCHFTVSP